MKINKIYIKNFKSIDVLEFKPTMVNIIIGRNNTGKTSILEAIAFAYDNSVIEKSHNSIRNRPSSIINYHDTSGKIEVNMTSIKERKQLEVTFGKPTQEDILASLTERVKANMEGLLKVAEELERRKYRSKKGPEAGSSESLKPLNYNFLIEESIIKLIGTKKLIDASEESLRILREGVKTDFYGIEYWNLIKESINEIIKKFPDKTSKYLEEHNLFYFNRSSLFDYDDETMRIKNITKSNQSHKESNRKGSKPIFIRDPIAIVQQLKNDTAYSETTAFEIEKIIKSHNLVPGLERFNFDGLVFSNTKRDVQMESMGDGFKVLIGLLGILLTQPESTVMLLEEPEVHMHPGYLHELTTYLVEMARSRNIQLFISTHSMDLIQNLLDIEFLSEENQNFVKSELSIFRLSRSQNTVILEEEDYSKAVENIHDLGLDLRGL